MATPIQDDPLWGVKELAKYFSVTTDTIRDWRRIGWLPQPDMYMDKDMRLIRWRVSTLTPYLQEPTKFRK